MSGVFVCVCICAERASGAGERENGVTHKVREKGPRTSEVEKLKKGSWVGGQPLWLCSRIPKPPPRPSKREKIKRYEIIITSYLEPSFLFFPFHQPPKPFFYFFFICTNSTFTSFSSYLFFLHIHGKKKMNEKNMAQFTE